MLACDWCLWLGAVMADDIADQIEDLILQASDPKDKAFLLIMNKIANSLDENTSMTASLKEELTLHRGEFRKHEETEMALINQGRGFWRAALAAIVVFQGIFVWWIQGHLQETERMQAAIKELQLFQAEHSAHHKEERETYKAWMNGAPKP